MTEPEEDLGRFYSAEGVMRRLGVHAEALDALVDEHALLELPGDEGSRLFPAFQFEEHNARLEVVEGLAPVMEALAAAGVGPMTIAAWLTAPTDGLDGETAVEHLRDRRPIGPVLDLVASDARIWGEGTIRTSYRRPDRTR